MKKLLGNILRFVLFLSLGFGILYLLYNSQNKKFQEECALKGVPAEECSLLDKVLTDFSEANYFWIFIVLALFTISNFSRAARWMMLIRPLGYQVRFLNALLSIFLGYFANLGLPRIGEVIRAGTLAQYEKIGVEKVMGTIVVDRIIDVISILLVTALAIGLEYDTIWTFVDEKLNIVEKVGSLSSLLIKLSIAGVVMLALFFLFRKRLQQFSVYKKIEGLVQGFVEGLKSIRQLDRPWLFFLHSINIWLMYYLMNYICFFAFEPTSHLSPLVGLVVFVFGGWGIVVPSPGGMGTYHFMIQTALAMYGISGDDGFSFANIAFFSIQLGCNVLLGILSLILLPIINRNNA